MSHSGGGSTSPGGGIRRRREHDEGGNIDAAQQHAHTHSASMDGPPACFSSSCCSSSPVSKRSRCSSTTTAASDIPQQQQQQQEKTLDEQQQQKEQQHMDTINFDRMDLDANHVITPSTPPGTTDPDVDASITAVVANSTHPPSPSSTVDLSPGQRCHPTHLSHVMSFLTLHEFICSVSTCHSWNLTLNMATSWPNLEDHRQQFQSKGEDDGDGDDQHFHYRHQRELPFELDITLLEDIVQTSFKRLATLKIRLHEEDEEEEEEDDGEEEYAPIRNASADPPSLSTLFDRLTRCLPFFSHLTTLDLEHPSSSSSSKVPFESIQYLCQSLKVHNTKLCRLRMNVQVIEYLQPTCLPTITTLRELELCFAWQTIDMDLVASSISNLVQLERIRLRGIALSISCCLAVRHLSVYGELRRIVFDDTTPMALPALAVQPNRIAMTTTPSSPSSPFDGGRKVDMFPSPSSPSSPSASSPSSFHPLTASSLPPCHLTHASVQCAGPFWFEMLEGTDLTCIDIYEPGESGAFTWHDPNLFRQSIARMPKAELDPLYTMYQHPLAQVSNANAMPPDSWPMMYDTFQQRIRMNLQRLRSLSIQEFNGPIEQLLPTLHATTMTTSSSTRLECLRLKREEVVQTQRQRSSHQQQQRPQSHHRRGLTLVQLDTLLSKMTTSLKELTLVNVLEDEEDDNDDGDDDDGTSTNIRIPSWRQLFSGMLQLEQLTLSTYDYELNPSQLEAFSQLPRFRRLSLHLPSGCSQIDLNSSIEPMSQSSTWYRLELFAHTNQSELNDDQQHHREIIVVGTSSSPSSPSSTSCRTHEIVEQLLSTNVTTWKRIQQNHIVFVYDYIDDHTITEYSIKIERNEATGKMEWIERKIQ